MDESVSTITDNINTMVTQYDENNAILAACSGKDEGYPADYVDADGAKLTYTCNAENVANLRDTNNQLFNNIYTNFQILSDANAKSTVAYVNQSAASDIFAEMNTNTVNVVDSLENVEKNKLRMVQINDYYSKRYDAETAIVKKVIIVLVVFLLISILSYKKLIPTKIAAVICGILLFVTAFIIYMGHTDIESRDKLYFDEFDWGSNTPGIAEAKNCTDSAPYCYVSTDANNTDLSGNYVHCETDGAIATSTTVCGDGGEELCKGDVGVDYIALPLLTKGSTCDAFTTLNNSAGGKVVKSPFPLKSATPFESATTYAAP
jgi:hypothetical protein